MQEDTFRGKSMIKASTIFLLSLTLFPLISFEFLPAPLIAIFVGLLILRIKKSLPKLVIFIISTGIVFYIKSLFGSLIIPETTISFLATMCLARFLAQDNTDYRINRLLGFLWAACFILFRTDLLAILILSFTTLILLKTITYKDDDIIKISELFTLKNIKIKETLLGILLVILLFIFFPRIYHFLPGVRNQPVGQVGYSKTINNSNAGSIRPSSQTAFIAQIQKLPNEALYWRGRVHTFTDGHNWRGLKLVNRKYNLKAIDKNKFINYQIKYEQDFDNDLILLDIPYKIDRSNLRTYKDKEFQTFKTYAKRKKSFVSASSIMDHLQLSFDEKNIKHYLQLPGLITQALNPLIHELSNKKNLKEILIHFKKYLNDKQFTYTLSPKGATTLKGFLENKQGYCTHFSSLLGIVLRKLKYPTRLISGFQGGVYNNIGKFYKVSSNDAHTWVEVFDGKIWQRVDPTSFIAPERVIKGGEAFFTEVNTNKKTLNKNILAPYYYSAKQYWDNLNYKVSLFFDTYDRDKQRSLSNIFKLKRYIFIFLGFVLFIIILGIFYFLRDENQISLDPIDQNFLRFIKLLEKNKIFIKPTDNLSDIKEKIQISKLINKNDYYSYLNQYQYSKYSKDKDIHKLKRYLIGLR